MMKKKNSFLFKSIQILSFHLLSKLEYILLLLNDLTQYILIFTFYIIYI